MGYLGRSPANVPVTADDIPDNSITAAKILDGVITAADIGANAVNTSELVDDAVTADKLANSINTEIAANTAKTGITSGQASAITANTAKTGITSGQASAIATNTAKTGITSGQASAITANTAKVTNATHTGDVTGSGALTIAADAVDGTKIADNSIAIEHISDNAVGVAELNLSDGTTGQFIKTDGSGTISFGSVSSGATGGGTDEVFVNNTQTITQDYTVPVGKSASSTGPITMNAGVDIILSAGSRWVIL